MAKPPIIFLVGYMACGKTTLGRALERAGHARFVDLDEWLTARSGLTPAEWFAHRGEASFRAAEADALRAICAECAGLDGPVVVGAGGGTPCAPGAMELMKELGTVVWLEASPERTVERLLDAPGSRPVVAGKDRDELQAFIPAHFESRKKYYSQAHIRFDSSKLDTAAEIDETVRRFVRTVGAGLKN